MGVTGVFVLMKVTGTHVTLMERKKDPGHSQTDRPRAGSSWEGKGEIRSAESEGEGEISSSKIRLKMG